MMIRHLIAAALLGAPALAAAQTTVDPSRGRLEILGTAPSACLIRTPAAASGSNATFQPTGGSTGEIRISRMVDATTAQSLGASIDLVIPVICNSPHRVVVRSSNGGLRRIGRPVAPGRFRDLLPYEVNTVWGDSQQALSSEAGTPVLIVASTARAGQLSLSLHVAAGGQPLVAGIYGDQIVLELTAAD
ncbi:MAG TPA: hypothetical protein VIT38_11445 [Allosphingosinicella sp.]